MNILGIILTKDKAGFHVLDFKFETKNSEYISRFDEISNKSISFYDEKNNANHYLAFSEFWNVQKYIVRYESKPDINIKEKLPMETEKNLTSISLAVFLAPLTKQTDYKFSFTQICATGLVRLNEEQGEKEVIVDSVTQVKEKYEAFSKYVESHENYNDTFAFVYVSNEKIDPKIENKKIKAFHIFPDTPVEELLDKLSSGFRRPINKFYQFNNAVYAKLSESLGEKHSAEKQASKSFKAQIYLSGSKNSKNFFDFKWFDIFRQAIDLGYKFRLSINISKFLSNNEITSDDMSDNLKPKWWGKGVTDKESIEVNERLKRLDLFVRNQVEVLKRYVYETYAYENSEYNNFGKLNVSVNYCNSENIELLGENETENALIVELNGKNYLSYSSGDYFEYNVYEKNASLPEEVLELEKIMIPEEKSISTKFIDRESSLKIIEIIDSEEYSMSEKTEEIGKILRNLKSQNVYLPRFTLYGLPASGKSTLIKKIADLYKEKPDSENNSPETSIDDIHIIASDYLINERIFDDNKSSRHNPNKEAKKRELAALNEHVIYTRGDYESFLNGGHDMDIRNLAVEIAIRQSAVTHDLCDLGGKEVLIERTRFLLNDLGFITVFICPDGEPDKSPIVFKNKDKEIDSNAYFDAYYDFYFHNHSLFDKSKRRNIYELGEPFKVCKNDKDEIIDIEPENWDAFKDKLQKRIFNPRFYFYNRKYDLKVFRRGSEDEMVFKLLKGILKVYLERLAKEDECH
ncbi:hypothetical protein [uncultured Treponema sp.]|uniref:hypothetical protein n=1 Tax=uncultured Treponema sp. TaxID=162155 RepID=UPI0025F5A876|nr:hypothetical protein [uncultured Treponema sp.]